MEYGELGVQKAPTPGDKTWASCVLAATWCRVGDAPRGIAVLSQAVSVLRAARFIWSEVCALWLAEGYALAGEHEQARRALEEVLDSASRHGMKFHIGCAHRLLGEIALRTNPAQVEAPLAAPHFDHSLAILQEIEAENELALAYASYGRLHHQQGNVAKSRECLTRAIEIFERLGTSIEPDRLRRALAEVSEG